MTETAKKFISNGIGVFTGTMASALIHKVVKAAPEASLKDKIIVTVGTWGISLAVANAVTKATENEISSYFEVIENVGDVLDALRGKNSEEAEDGRD